jgi:NADPH2:quinone reductase
MKPVSFAITLRAHGGPEQLVRTECEPSSPPRHHVSLRQTAIGVNFIDVYNRNGLYPLPSLPHGIGQEAVGEVLEVGDGVTDLRVGDRVGYAIAGAPGAYATHRCVEAWRCVPVPRAIDDVTAAGILLKGLTAEMLVRRVWRVGPGQRALVHAAAGGVGLLLCQWLRHLGAHVHGVVSGAAKAEAAMQHGCHRPIVDGEEDFVDVVRIATKRKGVDVVYDSTGKSTLLRSLQCLRARGMLVAFGNSSGAPEPLDLLELTRNGSLFCTRPTLLDYTRTVQELQRSAQALFTVVQQGAVKPPPITVLPLADASAAHRLLEDRSRIGAIVLVP